MNVSDLSFYVTDFSLNTYLEENHLSLTDNLDDLAANLLLEKLDLARFLKNPPCTVNRQSADGWDSCKNNIPRPGWMDGWMDGWVGGWVGGYGC